MPKDLQAPVSNPLSRVPQHIGLILDGNRRWAKAHNLPKFEGHRRGYDNLREIALYAFEKGVNYVSAFIFSTENWNRTEEEVGYLMNLVLKVAEKDTKELIAQNIKIAFLGSEARVPEKVVTALRKAEEDSANNTGGTLALCFNYGGYQEIADAVKQIIRSGASEDSITSEFVAENLYHPEIPAIDLMIRSSGEQRLSNFMLWRVAYSELYFTDTFWPDFTAVELNKALESYSKRTRRFGAD